MRRLFIVLLSFIALNTFVKANIVDTTKLIIIGTRHDGNAFIKPDSFLQIFRSFNPAIILCEADSTSTDNCRFVEGKGVEIAIKFNIYKRSIETQSILQYQEEQPNVCIKGYDIFIANRFQYIKDLEKLKFDFEAALDSLYNSAYIKKADKQLIAKYNRLFYNIIHPHIDKGLYFINQPQVTEAFSKIQSIKRKELLSFFKKYPSLHYIEKKYRADIDFWEERNTEMVKNILAVIHKNPAKKIIVLCGARHKYFLLQHLLPLQEKLGFHYVEWW